MNIQDLGSWIGSMVKAKPVSNPTILPNLQKPLISKERFIELTGVVIDNFEGGYYHPRMLVGMKASDRKLLAASGETMFGLDRKAGAALSQYPEWTQFWKTIDLASPGTWKHYYMGGNVSWKLKELAGEIMFKWFSHLAGKYILVSSMDEIGNDDRLMIHFAYGCWNGEKWFERYSKALNKAIQKYPDNTEQIFQEAIKARTQAVKYVGNVPTTIPNVAIRNQGIKMMALFRKMKLLQAA